MFSESVDEMSFAKFTQATLLLLTGAAAILASRPTQAQTETVLHDFAYTDGQFLIAGLTSDGAGNFYGAATLGGTGGAGTVFEISPDGNDWTTTVLYNFTGEPDGAEPIGSLIFDHAGNLYGATQYGGLYGKGAVFELTPGNKGWKESVLYSFTNGSDGEFPATALIIDAAGNLYGAIENCGTRPQYHGAVFELSPSPNGWTERVIYSAGKKAVEIEAGLTMDSVGNIFGVSDTTLFKLSPDGNGGWNSTALYDFVNGPNNGEVPQGTPIVDQVGNIFGTTALGGLGSPGNGTVYEVSPGENGTWTEKILYSFKGGSNGGGPFAGVILDANGNLYGSTRDGGKPGSYGTVFELKAPVGKGRYQHKVLWRFNGADGEVPYGGLILDGSDNLYGTTYRGGMLTGYCAGSDGCGVAFKLTP